MDNHEVRRRMREYLQRTNGWLTIYGIGMTRQVYVMEPAPDTHYWPLSKNSKVSGYNWGYVGDSPERLSNALLRLFLPEEDTYRYVDTFTATIVAILPQENFCVQINMRKWLELNYSPVESFKQMCKRLLRQASVWLHLTAKPKPVPQPKIHAYSLMRIGTVSDSQDIELPPLFFPKYLDLPFLPFSTAVFKAGTIEHKFMSELSLNDYSHFKTYCDKYSLGGMNKRAIQWHFDTDTDTWVMWNGLGSAEEYKGHNIDEYGY